MIPRVEGVRQFTQVLRDLVRLQRLAGDFHHFREAGDFDHQPQRGLVRQQAETGAALAEIVRQALLLRLTQQAAHAGMRILHVEHRVVIALLAREIDVEGQLGIGLARDQEPARRVAAHFIDQVAQRQVAAGALGQLHFLAATHHRHHLVQHVFRPALGNAEVHGLQAGAHARQRTVVVGAQLGDRAFIAALPLGQVVGDVRHEVGIGAVGLAHHAVLVVAEVGGLQPQRAAFLVGMAGSDQLLHRLLDLAVAVQRAFQEVDVEVDAERGQVVVLLVAQVGHGKAADRIEILRILAAGDQVAFQIDRFAGQVGLGDVADVVATVAVFRPAFAVRGQAERARLHRAGEVLDLHAGVVVVELALHVPAVGIEHARQAVADGGGAAVADVQRAGRIGRHILDTDVVAVATQVAPVIVALLEHAGGFALVRGGCEVEIDEARAGDLHPRDVVAGRQCLHQRLRQRARIGARCFGQQHRGVGGEVAMLTGLRAFDHEVRRQGVGRQGAVGAQGFDALTNQGAELGFHGGFCWSEKGGDFNRPDGHGRGRRSAARRLAVAGAPRGSDPAAGGHRNRGAVPDHQMVDQADVQQPQRAVQAPGEAAVGGGRLRVAGRVVMADDHRGRVVGKRTPQHFTGMYLGLVDRAAEEFLEGQRAVAGVQEKGREHLLLAGAKTGGEIAAGGIGVQHLAAPLDLGLQVPAAEFQGGRQPACARRAQPGQADQIARLPVQQPAQLPGCGQQFARRPDGVLPAQAGAEKDRQQFGVRQFAGPLGEELFARTLANGPMFYVHMARMHGARGPRCRSRNDLRLI